MDHRYQDRVSLEMARRVAAMLPSRPDLIAMASENLDRWSRLNANAPGLLRCYAEWQAILTRLVDEVCDTLTQQTDEGQRLRQNSPFVGAIPYDEVMEIKRRFRGDAIPA